MTDIVETGSTPRCNACFRPIIGTPMKMGFCGDAYHVECTLPPQSAAIERLRAENERLRRLQHAFRNADAMDWSRLFGMLEDADDGAYSRFWLAVLTETKEALAYDAANTPANTDYAKTDKTDATP